MTDAHPSPISEGDDAIVFCARAVADAMRTEKRFLDAVSIDAAVGEIIRLRALSRCGRDEAIEALKPFAAGFPNTDRRDYERAAEVVARSRSPSEDAGPVSNQF